MNDLIQAVSTVGFPIVMCAAMFYQLNKNNERHTEEINKMVETINNNTIALTKLVEREDFKNADD